MDKNPPKETGTGEDPMEKLRLFCEAERMKRIEYEECKSFADTKTVKHNPDGAYEQVWEVFRGLNGALLARPKPNDEGRFKVTKDKFYH